MHTFPRSLLPALAVAALLAASPASAGSERREPPQTPPTPSIDADEWLSRAALLASDEFAGRESGTDGGRMTEEYVAAELRRLGLEPLGSQGSYFQDVPLPSRNPDPAGSKLFVVSPEGRTEVGGTRDVIPFAFSAAGTAEGQVAFAGFGLTDAENEYDDYVGLDINGKVVLILRHAPQENADDSPWKNQTGRARFMMSFMAKAARAAAGGATAVLLVNDYNHEEDGLPVAVRAGRDAAIPVLAITRPTAERLFEGAGTTLRELQAAIDGDRRPRSRLLPTHVSVTAAIESQTARNVVVVRRGRADGRPDEAVVACAHMDHVGMGWFGSPAGGGQVHNGADDNASGTAALLEMAEWLAEQPAPRRSVVIAFWCGEEKGLIGSRHYVDNPLWPLEKTVACVNMDMVGRYRAEKAEDEGLMVGGASTGSTFQELIDRLAVEAGARKTDTWQAWEQSDHYAFYAKQIPSLFLTTGLHAEYHRPEDDWWLLNADGAALVTGLAGRLTLALADAETKPTFAPRPPRPVLGVQLADDPERDGALMGRVVEKTAAANAGILTGDLIVSFGGAAVGSARELGQLIGERAVGDVVEVVLLRGEERITVSVTLDGR